MKQVDIIARDASGKLAVLRLTTDTEWIPMELSYIGKQFSPVGIETVELYNTTKRFSWYRMHREEITVRCIT